MVVLGVDPHKKTHTVVAVDEATSRRLAVKTIDATTAGLVELRRWARRFPERRWAVEDGRHVSGRLVRELSGVGEQVTCVPTRLMAAARTVGRERGKSDPIDALAVARAAIAEPSLPAAHLDAQAVDLRLLVDHRENLVAERTRTINRLRWHLVDLTDDDHDDLEPKGKLTSLCRLDELTARLEGLPAGVRRDLAVEMVADIRAVTVRINALERDIRVRVTPLAPTLLGIIGINALTAAKLWGEVAGIDRFTTSAKLANHAGTACIPVWSGNHEKHRLNRGANRQLNCAVHRVAITQKRAHPAAAALYARRRAQGDTKAGALRVLKRHLIDVIYRAMKTDATAHHQTAPPLAA